VKNESEPYHYYMALCEYKKGNHLASLEHLKSDKLIDKYVSMYIVIITIFFIVLYYTKLTTYFIT